MLIQLNYVSDVQHTHTHTHREHVHAHMDTAHGKENMCASDSNGVANGLTRYKTHEREKRADCAHRQKIDQIFIVDWKSSA